MATFHGYVHVPFCRVRCGYCDFNTYTSEELDGYPQTAFLKHLEVEVQLARQEESVRPLSTVFFGGGTPTLLPANELAQAFTLLKETFGLEEGAEVTTEANPDTLTFEYLETLKHSGFTRISVGMQSANRSVLKTLDRTHSPEAVSRSIAWAKDLGLHTSVDLIYGAPGETFDQWKESVDTAIGFETDHISAYALILEPATKLARAVNSGLVEEPDDDLAATKYEWIDSQLASNGFHWYELSNWAKSEISESRHNIAYWQGQDWWGFGPGAHSHMSGSRWSNLKHPSSYARVLQTGEVPAENRETITATQLLEERAMLELRLRTGLDVAVVSELNPNHAKVISGLIADGLVDGKSAISGRLILTLKGRLLADFVLRKLLGL